MIRAGGSSSTVVPAAGTASVELVPGRYSARTDGGIVFVQEAGSPSALFGAVPIDGRRVDLEVRANIQAQNRTGMPVILTLSALSGRST